MTNEQPIKVGDSYLPEELWERGYLPEKVIDFSHPVIIQKFGPQVIIYRNKDSIAVAVNYNDLVKIVRHSDLKSIGVGNKFYSDFAENLRLGTD